MHDGRIQHTRAAFLRRAGVAAMQIAGGGGGGGGSKRQWRSCIKLLEL